MMRTRGILVVLGVVALLAAGRATTPPIASQPAHQAEALAVSSVDSLQSDACDVASDLASSQGQWEEVVKPGCCSNNCNVDKDCDRICGKGVCACIQESSCCRRCTY